MVTHPPVGPVAVGMVSHPGGFHKFTLGSRLSHTTLSTRKLSWESEEGQYNIHYITHRLPVDLYKCEFLHHVSNTPKRVKSVFSFLFHVVLDHKETFLTTTKIILTAVMLT